MIVERFGHWIVEQCGERINASLDFAENRESKESSRVQVRRRIEAERKQRERF